MGKYIDIPELKLIAIDCKNINFTQQTSISVTKALIENYKSVASYTSNMKLKCEIFQRSLYA